MGLNTAASLSFSQINSTVFFTNGNLGVNTTSPAFNLDVNGTINVSGKSTLQNITATNISSSTLISTTSVSSGILSATNIIGINISTGTLSATTITGSNLSLSGDLIVGGTLTTVNIASTNMVNTNISTGTLNVSGKSTLTNTTATNISTGILIASTGITAGTIRATGTSSLLNTTATNISSSTLIATTSITTGALSTSNITVSSLIANTGITTSSLNANVVNLSQNINNLLISTGSLTDSVYQQFINGNGARGIIGLDGYAYAGFNYNAFTISTWSNNPLNFATNQVLRATITTSGNFGIGTATPGFTLDVSGSINATTSITTAALLATAISAGSIISTGITTSALLTTVGITTGSIRLNSNSIYLRTGTDTNNGLSWVSSPDGIRVYGNSGGMLGYNSNSPSLYWNGNNQVGVGGLISNSLSNKLSINTTTDTPAINNDATNTLLVYEDMMDTSLRSGNIQGVASYVQNTGGTTGYVQLTPDGGGTADYWWYNRNLGNAFTVDYEIQCPGNGNEYWFYWGNTTGTNNTGYVIVFNEVADTIYLYFGGFIASASVAMGGSTNWFKVRIVYQRNVIKIYYNGVLVINYKDTVERNLNYDRNQIGFYSSNSVSAHRIREVKIQKLVEGLWSYQSQTSGNIIFNGGNVGINTSSPAYMLDINGNAMIRGNLYSSASTSAIPLPKASGNFYWDGSAIVSNNLYNCTVTRLYTGGYRVTFTNAMSDAFYTITMSFQTTGVTNFVQYYGRETTLFNIEHFQNDGLVDNNNRIAFIVW